ncbi:hypothetical protein E3N88_24150 [Mikania micrantha]|uniref:Uncharacterized protein n=1 Tax=Mikania micrantha TaxID=192012 RepID=A0A5N6NGE5_9ASTR|nr:hypothetical protein E3N88_24150 [Mikania micrantha]
MGFRKLLHFKVNGIPQKIGHYIVDNLDVSTMEIVGREGPIKVNQEAVFRFTIVECHAHGKCKLDVLNYLGEETEISKINWCSYVVDCVEKCKYRWLPNTKSPFKGALAILTLLYVDNVQCKGMNVDHTIPPIEFWNMEKLKQRDALEFKEISESGNLGNMMDLERMLEQTMCNKKKMELAIVKKFEDEPNNHMVRLMVVKFERIFNEKPCVVESLKEREVGKKNKETSQMSHEVFESGLGDDIDDRIMDVCLEINRHRQMCDN